MNRKAKSQLTALAGEVIRGLRQDKSLTIAELGTLARVSKNSVSNIEHGVTQQMQTENAKRLAKALGVSLSDITAEVNIEVKNPALGALGLVEVPSLAPDDQPFQSLDYTRTNQPLAYTWYDYRTENLSIRETQAPGSGRRVLECRFSGGKSSMASNFALHPENHTPRAMPRQKAIGFSALVTENRDNRPFSLAVRIVDRKGREWVLGSKQIYGQQNEPHLFPLSMEQGWIQCIIYLTPYPTALHTWYLFRPTSADRSPNLRPDWSVVARIVVEIGEIKHVGHPSAGEGKILFTPIWIGTPSDLAKLLPAGNSDSAVKTKTTGSRSNKRGLRMRGH